MAHSPNAEEALREAKAALNEHRDRMRGYAGGKGISPTEIRLAHVLLKMIMLLDHNHVTRDIKDQGVCPACDRYYKRATGDV